MIHGPTLKIRRVKRVVEANDPVGDLLSAPRTSGSLGWSQRTFSAIWLACIRYGAENGGAQRSNFDDWWSKKFVRQLLAEMRAVTGKRSNK
jgi:hypothetical protein